MLQLQRGWGKQESGVGRGNKGRGAKEQSRPFPSCACSSSTTFNRYVSEVSHARFLHVCPHVCMLTPTSWPLLLRSPPPPPSQVTQDVGSSLACPQTVIGPSAHADVQPPSTLGSHPQRTSSQRQRLPGGCLLSQGDSMLCAQ